MSQHPPNLRNNKVEIHLWWITAALIAINVALFAWQVLNGMNISNPSPQDAIRWGADYAPLTFLAEPIRLFSSMFFHFGLVHLMLNMWALYIFGSVSEQLFGRAYFIVLYVCAGLMGSLLSGYVSIQDSYTLLEQGVANPKLLPSVGAGASGAVMGLGAALTVLALLPQLPRQKFLLDGKTLVMVMALNLGMGFMISGINNAAHIGGMLMGAAMTLIWYLGQRSKHSNLVNSFAMLLAPLGCAAFYWYCHKLLAPIQPLWQELLSMMQRSLG
ncbi:rhomboid family intramembrane serine protease [Acinetobacter towneri]|uniref:rhomboid family intramembrane serine protease n=1 Tax=Acinetobacter towneri TaxID=202956 RepID=UPI001F31638C|nr:rhomboid family intramembrane serine protease [Acinetobacter towneri]UIP24485.1 rhomboid family intramembrane serine protease [Acinetobacter towneri]